MSYFNHAYKKTMLAGTNGVLTTNTGGAATMIAGQIAAVSPATYAVIDYGTTTNLGSEFILVQGNYNKKSTTAGLQAGYDQIGGNPLHGGYAESVKSKLIKTHFVTALWKSVCSDAGADVDLAIRVPDECYTCTKHAQLRIDIKGERVQRALNKNFYAVIDSKGCCSGTTPTFTSTDVVEGWRDTINNDPIMSNWITAASTASTGTGTPVTGGYAVLTITLKQEDETEFADCSLDTRDWYNTEPLTLQLTEVDDEGDACSDGCILDSAGVDMPVEGLTAIVTQDFTSGETVLRDIIQDGRYRQDGGWNQGNRDSARFREIQKSDNLLSAVNRGGRYTVFYLQHSVPRYNNPTGVFDNDQYLIAIAVECSQTAEVDALGNLWAAIGTETGLTVGTPGAVV